MSNYIKATDFAAKDTLASGNPAKVVKGTEIDIEFNSISTAISTKLDSSGGTDLAIADGGTGASTAANARTNLGAAASGANSDITSLAGLTTALSIAQGGTAATSASAARTSLGLAIGTDVQAYDVDIPIVSASQAEMEAGTEAALRSMSPLRVKQAISALGGAVFGETTDNANRTLSVSTDNWFVVRCTSGTPVYTFPTAVGNEGKGFWINNATTNDTAVRLVPNGTENIGGATGSTIYVPANTVIGFTSDGANWLVFGKTQMFWTFNANGTLNCPPGVYEIEVDGSGAGAGGSPGDASNGGGGAGSGERAIKRKIATVPGTAYTVTIGAGGGSGAAGGSTSLGAILTLAGSSGSTSNSGGTSGAFGMDGGPGNPSAGGTGGFGGAGGFGTSPGASAKANSGGGGGGGGISAAGGVGGSGFLRIRA